MVQVPGGSRRALTVGITLAVGWTLVPSALTTPAAATGCTEARAVLGPTVDDLSSVRLMLPHALTDRPLVAKDLSAARGADAVRVMDVSRPDSGLVDVALVVDSAADLPPATRTTVTDAALGLVAALPATSSVVVVAAGDPPRVLSPLSADHGSAAKALTTTAPLPGHRISDALLLALRQLQPSPVRYRHLVIIATGRDSSSASIDEMRSALTSYQPSIQVLDVGPQATYADAGEQCPVTVSPGHGREAGREVASRIRSEVRVLLRTVGDPTETTVRIRTSSPAVDAGVQIEPASLQLVPEQAPSTGLRAWLAGTTGRVALGALAVLFVALLLLNSRPVRRTLHSWRVKSAKGPKEKAPIEGVQKLSLTEALDRVTGDQVRADEGGLRRVRSARDSTPASVGGNENEPNAQDVEGAPAEAPVAEASKLASAPGPPAAGPPWASNDSADEEAPIGMGGPVAASQAPLPQPSAADRAAHARRLAAMRVAAQRAAERAAPAEAAPPPETADVRDVRDVRGGRVVTRPPGSPSN